MTTKTPSQQKPNPSQVFIPAKPLTKQQIDVQLIEACVLEKWNPIALGCRPTGTSNGTCVLCHVYLQLNCSGCPIKEKSGKRYCHNTPYDDYQEVGRNSPQEFNAIEAEIEFLISLLPETHQWRNNND